MKILVAIDETDRYGSILGLINAMKLPSVEIRFIHCVPPLVGYDGAYTAIAAINGADIYSVEREQASGRLKEACRQAEAMRMKTTWDIAFGYPAQCIADTANEFGADLIALAASPKGTVQRLLSGSTTLTVAQTTKHSLLIVRDDQRDWRNLTALFTTDHSETSRECLKQFVGWHPAGLSSVEVLTAYELVGKEVAIAGRNQVVGETEVHHVVKSLIQERTEGVAQRLRQAGIPAHAKCMECSTPEAIHETARNIDAKLLILSSKGHSYWSNLTGESTSINEIRSEPCSLLILRPETAKPESTPTKKINVGVQKRALSKRDRQGEGLRSDDGGFRIDAV